MLGLHPIFTLVILMAEGRTQYIGNMTERSSSETTISHIYNSILLIINNYPFRPLFIPRILVI